MSGTPPPVTMTLSWPAALCIAVAGLGFAVSTASCGDDELCQTMTDALEYCDLRADDVGCGEIIPGPQAELYAAYQDQGCEGLYDDEGRPKPAACELYGWPCPAPLFGATQSEAPIHATVFVSGIDDTALFDWNPRILDVVADETERAVHHIRLPGWETLTPRTDDLYLQLVRLRAQSNDTVRFNLICWAVGGLNCRDLISPTGHFADDAAAHAQVIDMVASVTTVATPHKGTNVADALLALPANPQSELAFASIVGDPGERRAERQARARQVLADITLDEGARLDVSLVDEPRVYGQSYAGVSYAEGNELFARATLNAWCETSEGTPGYTSSPYGADAVSPLLTTAALFAEVADTDEKRLRAPADGLISVHSARWRNFRGCVPADHYDLVGRLNDAGADPITGFDAARFYVAVVSDLARRGY